MARRVVHAGQPGVELRAEERGHVVVAVLGEQLLDAAAHLCFRDLTHARDRTDPARVPPDDGQVLTSENSRATSRYDSRRSA